MRATDTAEIGRTGLRVTRLGLGGVALSGAPPPMDPHRPAAASEAVSLIHRAVALGVNYVDTAPRYGLGESERRVGHALRDLPRDRVVVSTKVGRLLRPGSDGPPWVMDFSAAAIRASLDGSLERLGLPGVDILYLHDPDEHWDAAIGQALPVLTALRERGQVRAIGVGIDQWQMALGFARDGRCDCLLVAGRYTLLDQTALPELLPYCAAHGIGVIAGAPYNTGILAVGPRAGATFNYRAAAPELMERAERIAAVCTRHDVPLKAAALQFVLAHPAIVSVIPGARSVEEIEDNVRMVEHPIPPALWDELRDAGLIPPAAPTPA